MTIQIKWTDTCPRTGERRFICAERFAREWTFKFKYQRRGEWSKWYHPTRAMWEHVLDSLKRRYRRREGVSDEDVAQVEKVLRNWKEQPRLEANADENENPVPKRNGEEPGSSP